MHLLYGARIYCCEFFVVVVSYYTILYHQTMAQIHRSTALLHVTQYIDDLLPYSSIVHYYYYHNPKTLSVNQCDMRHFFTPF